MICPKCKAEYREGFYVCSDCELPLVTELSKDDAVIRNEFSYVELNLLKHLKFNRYLSIFLMAVFTGGILLAIYFLLFPEKPYETRHMNLVRLNGLVMMLGLSYFWYVSIRIIEKLQSRKK